MITEAPIGWINTGLPVLFLGAMAFVVPMTLQRRRCVSHVETAMVVWASAGILLILAAAVSGFAYSLLGARVGDVLQQEPVATVRFFLGQGMKSALVWLPILGLMWLNLSQRVEAERARRDRMEQDS